MSWVQVSPGCWQRPIGENERMIKWIGDRAHAQGREQWSINAVGTLDFTEVPNEELFSCIRKAWALMRFNHPSIAATAFSDTLNYQVPDTAALRQWGNETLHIISEPSIDASDLIAGLKPSPFVTSYFILHTRQIILHTAHWRTDGFGALQLLNAFLEALTSNQATATIPWGEEAARLCPSIEDVLQLPVEATEEIKAATADCLATLRHVPGSVGLPYDGTQATKPRGTRGIRRSLSENNTELIVSACEERNITLLSAVHASLAAINLRFAARNVSDSPNSGHYTSTMRFSLRPYLPAPFNTAQHASALYTGGYFAAVDPATGWREHATKYSSLYRVGLSHGFLISRRQYAATALNLMIQAAAAGPVRSEIDISSVDDAERLVTPIHHSNRGILDVEVKDISLGVECLAKETYLFCWTFRGNLEFNLVYNEAFYQKSVMETILDTLFSTTRFTRHFWKVPTSYLIHNKMAIPEECTVLVVGGGPGGSYAATVLAREGIDTVLLEAERMPRYHVGETMLPTIRHYLRFIDLEPEFDKHGFTKSVGAAFKFNQAGPIGFTNFLLGGSDNLAWNVVRSEGDELLFRHAGKSGAKAFDGVTVTSIDFAPSNGANGSAVHSPGKPISASWFKKEDGTSGVINFSYIIDATGRAGLLSTKYLKNRHYNSAINKSVSWAYFKNASKYGEGTEQADVPLYEGMRDETGWTWLVPLHDGTSSVGIIRDYALAQEKIKAAGSEWEYCKESLEQAPTVSSLLADAKAVTGVKTDTNYSYYASSYAFPNARIIGDAGCFTDIFFSSGVHLAITHALSAATSIAASIRGDVDEVVAAQWHSSKIAEGYSRFLLLVLSAYKQIRPSESFNAGDFSQEGFDREFGIFQSVTGGSQNDTGKITQEEFSHTYEFLIKAFKVHFDHTDGLTKKDVDALQAFRSHQGSHIMNINSFTSEVIDGLVPSLKKGGLTLVPAQT
ncbi:hypothetical protein SCUP234_05872 [Seiridium cupressi]